MDAESFLARIAGWRQLAFVTDEQLGGLVGGARVSLERLQRIDVEQGICARCGGICCAEIGCELFAAPFGRCPLHDLRPIACRLHFCALFGAAHRPQIVELRDLFVGWTAALEARGDPRLTELQVPPLGDVCAGLTAAVAPAVEAVRGGLADPRAALGAIRAALADHLAHCEPDAGRLPVQFSD
jgi:hypothetical protein